MTGRNLIDQWFSLMSCCAVSLPMHLAVPAGIWPFCGACREDVIAAPGSVGSHGAPGNEVNLQIVCGMGSLLSERLGPSPQQRFCRSSASCWQPVLTLCCQPCSQQGESTNGWHSGNNRELYWVGHWDLFHLVLWSDAASPFLYLCI